MFGRIVAIVAVACFALVGGTSIATQSELRKPSQGNVDGCTATTHLRRRKLRRDLMADERAH